MPPQRVASKTRDARGSAARAQVPAQLRGAFLGAVGAGRVRSMQNKLMPAAPLHRPGALLLGDAFNMRHPLTGATLGGDLRVPRVSRLVRLLP